MSDFRNTPQNSRGTSYRTQRDQKKEQALTELSQSLDIQHHDTSLRHTFGNAFDVPVSVTPITPGSTGSTGTSDIPARSDHSHPMDSSAPWTPWTPVLSAASGGLAMGSGSTSEGGYIKIGRFISFWARFVFGTTGMAAGTGQYRISTPIPLVVCPAAIGVMGLYDASSANRVEGALVRVLTSTLLRLDYVVAMPIGALGGVAATTPWTWAASDQIFVTCNAESVS